MFSKSKFAGIIGVCISLVIVLFLTGAIPLVDSRLRPSDTAAYLPSIEDDFGYYIEQNKARIKTALAEHFYSKTQWPFGPDYPLEQVVQMRAPFQIPENGNTCADPEDGAGKGFLLIHGLSDSPYLLSALGRSLADRFPCALIRSLLSPGHGTVPGDLRNVSREEWEEVTDYGVQSFRGRVSDLYVVGYSNGGALALQYLDEHRQENFIKGVVMLSPGLAANDDLIFLSPYVRYLLRWVNKNADQDAVKYESFAMNAAAEFYGITREVTHVDFIPLDVPVFMAMSADDTTVDNIASVEFFCQKVTNSHRQLLWYQSKVTLRTPGISCDGLEIISVDVPEPRFISYSHVGITMPADDPHYGMDGNYSSCLAYSEEPEKFVKCTGNNVDTVYGENTIRDENGLYQGSLVRRATFNPLYEEMIEQITCFINTGC